MYKRFELLCESDLTDDLKMIASVCGLDIVKILLENFSGLNFYVPKISHLQSFDIKYLKHHKEKPIKQITLELGVSEPFLKNLQKLSRKS